MRAAAAGCCRKAPSPVSGGRAICLSPAPSVPLRSRDGAGGGGRPRPGRFPPQTLFTSIQRRKLIIWGDENAANIDRGGWKQQPSIGWIRSANNLIQGQPSVCLRFISAANWSESAGIRIRFHLYGCSIQNRQRLRFPLKRLLWKSLLPSVD